MSDSHGNSEKIDIVASLVLVGATIAALIIANSAAANLYKAVLSAPIVLPLGFFDISGTTKTWIKDALMAVFFLLVGLEIKAEFREGALADRERAILPFAAATGGMAVPAVIYLVVVGWTSDLARGWAIPSATDIAFAVGVIGLLGTKIVPAGLKAFLLAVAVIDDLGAILIIALFYTAEFHLLALLVSAALIAVMVILNLRGIAAIPPYLALGLVLWVAMSQSGISPTLAGVIAALCVPLAGPGGTKPLMDLAHALKLPVLFLVMPIFAFANAGVSLLSLGLADFAKPLTLGIALGLLLGKPVGITLAAWATVRIGLGRLPEGATWVQVLGVAFIAGIGFTMSLFIGALAFPVDDMQNPVRLGVLSGSLLATAAGVVVLLVAHQRSRSEHGPPAVNR